MGQTFQRSKQATDYIVVVLFQTPGPGRHTGRTKHVHTTVYLANKTVLTSHIFFDEAINQSIYGDHKAHARSSPRDMLKTADSIAAEAGDDAFARVRMTEPDGAMEAALVVGINPEGDASGLMDRLWKRA